MAKTRTLEVEIAFSDSSKRTLKFSPLALDGNQEDALPSIYKTRVKAIKNETLSSIVIDGVTATELAWTMGLCSGSGASATGITGATYTVTETTRIYDSATYEPEEEEEP